MDPFFATLLLLALVGVLIYEYLIWNFGYWKRNGIKEAKSYPIVGSFPNLLMRKRNVAYDIDELYRQHKETDNFIGAINGRTPQLLILSAELAHKIYVNNFKSFHDNEFSDFVSKRSDVILASNVFSLKGSEWKSRRAETVQGMKISRMGPIYPVVVEVCKSFSKYIQKQMKMAPATGLDAKQLCLRFTTEAVSACVLGLKADCFTDNPTAIFRTFQNIADQSFGYIMYIALATLVPQIRKVYVKRLFSKKAETFLLQLMQTAIDMRRKTPNNGEGTDFINYIIELQDKKKLTKMELNSPTIMFLTDGFEPTASVLSHTLLLLARYPECQEKLRTKIGPNELSFEQLSELSYAEACINESIRLFSPLILARKLCTEPCEFVNKNGQILQLNRGQVALIPANSIHHDPDIYDEPEVFKPERFLPENGGAKKYREAGAFLGFGDGPRLCLGMLFAMTKMKAALVEIVRDYNIKVNPKTRQDNYLDETIFMANLKGGIWLDFEERK